MTSPALSLLNELVEFLYFEEMPIELRPQELQATEIHLFLDLVPRDPCHFPQVVGRLEEDVHVALLSTMGHELGLFKVITRFDHLLLREVYLPEVQEGVGGAAAESVLARDLERLLELADSPFHLADHRLAETDVDADECQIVAARLVLQQDARLPEALERPGVITFEEIQPADPVQRV